MSITFQNSVPNVLNSLGIGVISPVFDVPVPFKVRYLNGLLNKNSRNSPSKKLDLIILVSEPVSMRHFKTLLPIVIAIKGNLDLDDPLENLPLRILVRFQNYLYP